MPIRFRCVYCDKLLGIARRKAGAVVNCPQCGQPLIVPTPEPEPATAAGPPPAAGKLFERDDFEAILQGDATLRTPEALSARRSKTARKSGSDRLPPRPFPVERSLPPPPDSALGESPRSRAAPGGIVLSTATVIVLVLVSLILMGAAFAAGILVGRMLH